MAKIGTAQIEIKPVLNEEALAGITQQIEDAVADAVAVGFQRGMNAPGTPTPESAAASMASARGEVLGGATPTL